MPIDASIYDRLIQPVKQPDSFADIVTASANMKNAQTLAEDRRMLVQDKIRQAQEDGQVRQVMSDPNTDMPTKIQHLYTINPKVAGDVQQSWDTGQKNHLALIQTIGENSARALGDYKVGDKNSWDHVRSVGAANYQMVNMPVPAVFQNPEPPSQEDIDRWMMSKASLDAQIKAKQEAFEKTDYVGPGNVPMIGGYNKKTNQVFDTAGNVVQNPVAAKQLDVQDKAADNARQAASDAERAKHDREMERHGRSIEARLASGGAAKGAGGPEIQIQPNSRDSRISTDVATGRLPYADFQRMYGRGAQFAEKKAAMYDYARQINPEFDVAKYEAGQKVASNPKIVMQVASLNNVLSGVPDLIAASNAADSAGLRVLNSYIKKGGFTIGGKAYTNLNTARTAFADELSGALGYGSATDMSREMGFNMTDTTLPPDKFAAAIQDVVVPFVNRKKASILGGMSVYGEPGRSPASSTGTVPASVTSALQSKPPNSPGKAYTLSDGSRWVKAADGSISKAP